MCIIAENNKPKDNLEVNQHFLTGVGANQSDALGISREKPKYPQYAVPSKRLESFKEWPEYLPLKPDVLVKAGLVYTGVGDSVRCYYCGGGLRNWELEDNPMVEHATWYPTCPHVLLVKGQSYVDMLQRGEKPPEEEVPLTQNQTNEDQMNSAAAQSCIQMGFLERSVKSAIDIFMQQHGNTDFNGAELCRIILDNEELDPYNTDNTESNVSELNSADMNELLSENKRLKENQMCKICVTDVANIIFVPCGHMVSCPQCAPALTTCPICRDAVNGYVKAYFSTADETQE